MVDSEEQVLQVPSAHSLLHPIVYLKESLLPLLSSSKINGKGSGSS